MTLLSMSQHYVAKVQLEGKMNCGKITLCLHPIQFHPIQFHPVSPTTHLFLPHSLHDLPAISVGTTGFVQKWGRSQCHRITISISHLLFVCVYIYNYIYIVIYICVFVCLFVYMCFHVQSALYEKKAVS